MKKYLLFIFVFIACFVSFQSIARSEPLLIVTAIEQDGSFMFYSEQSDKYISGRNKIIISDVNVEEYADFMRDNGDYVINLRCIINGKDAKENLMQIVFNPYVGYVGHSGRCVSNEYNKPDRMFYPKYKEGNIFTAEEIVIKKSIGK